MIIITSLISVAVIYTFLYGSVFIILNHRSVKSEEQIDFNDYSEGINWVNKKNTKTLFFIPSSEEIACENLYGDWLKELYNTQGINIIVPPGDPASLSPGFSGQSGSIDRTIDTTVYLYHLYTNLLNNDHEISILATGDGSIAAMELAKKYSSMDKVILISPVHSDFHLRGGTLLNKMEGVPFLHYIFPWLPASFGSERVGSYDILNDNLNNQFQVERGKYYPAYINMAFRRELRIKTDALSLTLEKVKPGRFFIIYGDEDISYGLEGFERMGDQLNHSGSEVSIMRIPQSGRLILFDNDRERIIDLISILLQ